MTRGDAQVDAEEAAERLKAVHWDRVKRKGSLAEASRRLGEDVGYLAGQKEHARGLRVQDALQSLELLGSPMPEEVLHEAFFSEPKDPAEILLYSKEHQDLKTDPLLLELTPRLRTLASAGPTEDGAWQSERPRIREIDRLRFSDRNAAYSKLESFLSILLSRMQETRPEKGLHELTSALGVLAAIYRLAGRRDDAADLLSLSWPLAVQARNAAARAAWFQKASYLLLDLNRAARAEEFIQRAHLLFCVAGSEREQLSTLVDFGYVLTETNRHAESLAHLEEIAPRMYRAEIFDRISAHQLSATNHRWLGNVAAAHVHLNQAFDLIGNDLLPKAYCLWRRAELLLGEGQVETGLACFREALPLFARLTGAAEMAQLALNYAGWLFQTGQWPELQNLAAELSGWLKRLKGYLRLRTTIEDFLALIRMEKLDEASFTQVRERIAAARTLDALNLGGKRRPSR